MRVPKKRLRVLSALRRARVALTRVEILERTNRGTPGPERVSMPYVIFITRMFCRETGVKRCGVTGRYAKAYSLTDGETGEGGARG